MIARSPLSAAASNAPAPTRDPSRHVVPSGDGEAFGKALVALAGDAELRARYGRASLERVANFSIESMVDRTLGLDADVLAGRAAPVTAIALGAAVRRPARKADKDLARVGAAGAEMESA